MLRERRGTRARAVGRVLLGAAVVLAVGAVVLVRFWGPREPEPSPDAAAQTVTPAELGAAAGQRVFIGHMSIGWNMLDGLQRLYADADVPEAEVVQVSVGDPPRSLPEGQGPSSTRRSASTATRWASSPTSTPPCAPVSADEVDVAMVKLCFTDVTAKTDVDAGLRRLPGDARRPAA